jgi:Dna[CI] antecedent DciA-like protein
LALAPIANEAREFSRKLGLSTDLALLERAWLFEVGGLKEAARIVALNNASLVVETDSHAVMQEVSLRRRELVRKLNQHLPAPLLRQIHVRIAESHGR